MKTIVTTFLSLFIISQAFAQSDYEKDSVFIKSIFTEALEHGHSYDNLRFLCKNIGARLSGSEEAAKAVEWGEELMRNSGFDSVWLQPVMVPHWVRGKEEKARIILSNGKSIDVDVTALGNSEGSGEKGVEAKVVEVKSIKELKAKSKEEIEGKIVFINDPMPLDLINPNEMYGQTSAIRFDGPADASRLGAVGVITRSLNPATDDYPHTGVMSYGENARKIPAASLSTKDSDYLSKALKQDPGLEFYLETHCGMKEDVPSNNVVGEIKGSEDPDEIIVVGGHLDSWDVGEGAHDDGAGVIHAQESLRILKALDYQPKHTIRVVFYMNEENGSEGGKKYAQLAQKNREKHIAAIESDIGGFLPLGFNVDAADPVVEKIQGWKKLFGPYHMHEFQKGYGGADINPLKEQDGVPLLGLWVNTQMYFNLHHSEQDTFDKVVRRELEMGCAGVASMIYLIDQHEL